MEGPSSSARAPSGHRIDMLQGSLWDKVLIFAVPLAASGVLQQLFNSADVAVVGRFVGNTAQAAVGSTSALVNLFINLFVGLSVGANALIARLIGQGKEDDIQRALHCAIAVALIGGVTMAAVATAAIGPALALLRTPDDVIGQATMYLRIYFAGMPFILLYNFGAAILRSKGDSRRPLYVLFAAGILNVALNLLLVVVFHLDVAGVAIATIIANALSSGLVLWFLVREEPAFRLQFRRIAVHWPSLYRIMAIGVPAGLQGMVFSLSNLCIQYAVNSFGSATMAGSIAGWYYEIFAFFMVAAFGQSALTFTSQNFGAGNLDRCKRIFRICMGLSLACSGLVTLAYLRMPRALIGLYSADEAVIAAGVVRMKCAASLVWLTCFYEICGSSLRALGSSMLPAVITLVGTCLFRVFWVVVLFPRFQDFGMLMLVYPATWILTGGAMMVAYFLKRRKLFRLCGQGL